MASKSTIGFVLLGIVAIGGFVGGQQYQSYRAIKQTPAKRAPETEQPLHLTAAEEFDLRTKCTELADKMKQEGPYGLVGNALTSEMVPHYNPETNHCYVEFEATKNFSFTYPSVPTNYRTTSIYDGQTKELLVFADQEGEKSSGTIWTAAAFSDRYVTYDRAIAEIDRLMQNNDK